MQKQVKIAAVMPAYNEEDVIYHTIKNLVDNNIHVHILDNESTDSTLDIVKQFPKNQVSFSSFSTNGEFNEKLQGEAIKKAFNKLKEDYDWLIRNDADEFLESPLSNLNVKQAIEIADKKGFNSIGTQQFYFCPTSEEKPHIPGEDIRKFYNYFQIWDKNKYFQKEFHPEANKIWKINIFKPESLTYDSAHSVAPLNKIKLFPNLFIIRHYLYKSPEATRKKIFKDRKQRLSNWNITNKVSCRYLEYSEDDDFLFDNLKREHSIKKNLLRTEAKIKKSLPLAIKKFLSPNLKKSLRSYIKDTLNFSIRLINSNFKRNKNYYNLPDNIIKWSDFEKPEYK